ncbi:hypothetical protein LTR37_010804 [Vermiconidia calcicola]|uniref:Uncharacterized protein n=1 Tax=Vermiconidia calcicola TaxID=1690605 RepID=A0ACC3N6T3_9PEZI|nr:hypothetical protein LTR37_010804 [Vermiconidia calcicola]
MASSLESITPELQSLVMSYIPRQTDLKNLCLTSKQLRSIAVPRLYRAVKLEYDAVAKHPGLFQQDHPGHELIRYLDFRILHWLEKRERTPAAGAIKYALQLMPSAILKRLTTPHIVPLDVDFLRTISSQQRNLQELSLGPIMGDASAAELQPSNWLTKINGLELTTYIGGEKNLEFYSRVIRQVKRLNYLYIRTTSIIEEIDDEASEWIVRDIEETDDLVFRKLFSQSSEHGAAYRQIQLHNLLVQDVFLGQADSILFQGIRFELLRYLTIYYCSRADLFLRPLAEYFRKVGHVSLRGLRLSNGDMLSWITAIEDLLKSFSGLQFLLIREHCPDPHFNLNSLRTHASSLQHLYIGRGKDDVRRRKAQWRGSSQDWLRLLYTHNFEIRQLAIALPMIDVSRMDVSRLAPFLKSLVSLASSPFRHVEKSSVNAT